MARLVYSRGPEGNGGDKRGDAATANPVTTRELGEHDVRVRRDRSGRKGKTVTVCGPWYRPAEELKARLKRWKQRCGSGGAVKAADARRYPGGSDLELQGDHVELVLELLDEEGVRGKRSGG